MYGFTSARSVAWKDLLFICPNAEAAKNRWMTANASSTRTGWARPVIRNSKTPTKWCHGVGYTFKCKAKAIRAMKQTRCFDGESDEPTVCAVCAYVDDVSDTDPFWLSFFYPKICCSRWWRNRSELNASLSPLSLVVLLQDETQRWQASINMLCVSGQTILKMEITTFHINAKIAIKIRNIRMHIGVRLSSVGGDIGIHDDRRQRKMALKNLVPEKRPPENIYRITDIGISVRAAKRSDEKRRKHGFMDVKHNGFRCRISSLPVHKPPNMRIYLRSGSILANDRSSYTGADYSIEDDGTLVDDYDDGNDRTLQVSSYSWNNITTPAFTLQSKASSVPVWTKPCLFYLEQVFHETKRQATPAVRIPKIRTNLEGSWKETIAEKYVSNVPPTVNITGHNVMKTCEV